MKSVVRFSVVALVASFLLVGCGGSKKPAPQAPAAPAVPTFGCTYGNQPAPEWTCTPEAEGAVVALGEAKPNIANDRNMQRNTAVANARAALSQDIEVKVQTMITNWTRVTGAGTNQTYETNAENVSKQVANQTLQGTKIMKTWFASDGTMIVLVGMVENDQLKDSIKTSLKNDNALWQQFQSQNALEKLDSEIDKQFANQ